MQALKQLLCSNDNLGKKSQLLLVTFMKYNFCTNISLSPLSSLLSSLLSSALKNERVAAKAKKRE